MLSVFYVWLLRVGSLWFAVSCLAANRPMDADTAWGTTVEPLIQLNDNLQRAYGKHFRGVVYFATKEMLARQLIDAGRRFKSEYPEDPRWSDWLVATNRHNAEFWNDPLAALTLQQGDPQRYNPANLAVDENAAQEWRTSFEQLRNEFLTTTNVSADQRARFRLQENWMLIMRTLFGRGSPVKLTPRSVEAEKLRVSAALDLVEVAEMPANWTCTELKNALRRNAAHLLKTWELGDPGAVACLDRLTNSENDILHDYAISYKIFLRLRGVPLELEFTGIDGKRIDMKELRGKVVLIQYWSTTCGSCIGQLPVIRDVYHRYRDRGFVAVGLCGDSNERRSHVLDVMRKAGVDWPQRLDKERYLEEVERFGFEWASNVLLFDKRGHLVVYEAGIGSERLAELVETELKKEQ